MAQGFIRGPLDVRLLLLYILSRASFPVDEAQLLDIALCDDGMDYFQFADALSSLKNTRHITTDEDGKLFITEKGRANGSICENELAYSVRLRCDRSIAKLNKELMRQNQIRTSLHQRTDGTGVTVRMILDDDAGNLMTLDMLAPDRKQGEQIAKAFRFNAAAVYDSVLSALLNQVNQAKE